MLVCRKCSKKLGGGFGPNGRMRLAKALRHEPGFGKGRKALVGVVEVGCLGMIREGENVAMLAADLSAPDRVAA